LMLNQNSANTKIVIKYRISITRWNNQEIL
jgi:hypothetical protein